MFRGAVERDIAEARGQGTVVTEICRLIGLQSISWPWRRAWRCWSAAGTELFPPAVESALRRATGDGWQIDGQDSYCARCGATTGPHGSTRAGCRGCVASRPQWQRIVRLGPYREPLSDWIVEMKFFSRWTWAAWMGHHLAHAVPESRNWCRTVVCPVPMPWQRRVKRGYNQAALIGHELAARRGWPLAPLLRRTRYVLPQSALSASNRTRNARRSFALRRVDLSGWHVWLVDDVKTTGSTLSVCAQLLKRAGASEVNVAVTAVVDR